MNTRPPNQKFDSYIHAMSLYPYVQQQIHAHGLLNHHSQVINLDDYFRNRTQRKRLDREREAITQEIISRALKIEENNRRSRRHQLEVAARRAVDHNFDFLSAKYRLQSNGSRKHREKSAPGHMTKNQNDGERRVRVTSAHQGKSSINKDTSELLLQQNHLERIDKSSTISLERFASEITMLYGSKTTDGMKSRVRDEIVVMQQHITGENLVVYRGFITKGESFSFKSQRRATSPLSLAFYAKGFIDSIINDCCEYNYGKSHKYSQHGQFSIERVRKANPCEKCQKKYSQRERTPDTINTEASEETHFKASIAKSKPSIDSQEESSILAENHIDSKIACKTKGRRNSAIEGSQCENENENNESINERKSRRLSRKPFSKKRTAKERSGSTDFSFLQSTLACGESPSREKAPMKVDDSSSILKINSTEKIPETIPTTVSITPSQDTQNVQQWINQISYISIEESNNNLIETNNSQTLISPHGQQSENDLHQTEIDGVIRYDKSVENFIYILDNNLQISNRDKIKLRSFINFGFTFNNINDREVREFITQIVNEHIILILSKTSVENFDKDMLDYSRIRFIYVLDSHKSELKTSSEKIRGCYKSITNIYGQLEKDLIELTNDLNEFSTFYVNDANDIDFAYIQVLKDILLENHDETNLKKDMLDFCRHVYADNEYQLKLIDEFEENFHVDDAVNWYQRRDAFLYKVLTRAFRVPDPDLLFKFRYFIQCLHNQLKMNSSSASKNVYRFQYLSNDHFKRIIESQSGFFTFSQFITVYKTKELAQKSITKCSSIHTKSKLILFHIVLNPLIPRIALDENFDEILLTTSSIYRISNVDQKTNNLPIVKIISNDDVLKIAHELTKNLRDTTRASFPLLRMAKLMKQMDYLHYTEHFCVELMNNPSAANNETANLTLGGIFHALCSYYYEQEQYERALDQLNRSLKVYLRVLSPDDIKLTPTYNNMGSIFHKQGLDTQALEYHKKAYDIQVNSSNPDPDSVSAYASNIASVLVKQNKYEEAIPYLERDIQIRERLSSNQDDLLLAVKYHNLAGVLFRMNRFQESLENYQKCLQIELKSHSADHPTVGITYYNMATTYEGLGQLDNAIKMIRQAIERLVLTRSEDDEEVQMHKEYEKRLEQKLWVKNLFGTK